MSKSRYFQTVKASISHPFSSPTVREEKVSISLKICKLNYAKRRPCLVSLQAFLCKVKEWWKKQPFLKEMEKKEKWPNSLHSKLNFTTYK